MCGIAGIARHRANGGEDRTAVERMLAAQIARGPDGCGVYQDAHIVLGHRRLAIIDLSPAGKQPMSNEDGSVQVTFNGEIYNHRTLREDLIRNGHVFLSSTDTEVLVHGYEQWGIEGLLEQLRGMFAFALYDTRRGLFFARDRLGIKPLYYCARPDVLAFASEVKALLQSRLVPDERDRSAMAGFLMAGSVPGPRTIVSGIQSLPPGHWAEWRDGKLSLSKYWDFDSAPPAADSPDPLELRGCLEEAVRLHLIADVPLGLFLSGGVDSAALVALATRIRQTEGRTEPLRTLTVVFDEQEQNEANPAAEVARRFQSLHREVRVTSADFQRELPAFMAAMDQPTHDGVNSYFVSKAAREEGLKVVLSGLGGDEVFWGYKHYRWLRFGGLIRQCPVPVRRLAAEAGFRWGQLRRRDNWSRTRWLHGGNSSARVYLTMRGFFGPDRVCRLMDMSQTELDAALEEHFGNLGSSTEPGAASINYIEMKRYLHDQLLRDTDVFSMAHSIEARVPYLDHTLVERLWNTPPESKLDRNLNKPLLVRAADDETVLQAGMRPKRGFTFPMARWMKMAAPEMQEIAESGSLVRGAVRECWNDFSQGHMHWSRAWALTVLGATS
jgi:asparagine synthase (glutamine-hydrolysing)